MTRHHALPGIALISLVIGCVAATLHPVRAYGDDTPTAGRGLTTAQILEIYKERDLGSQLYREQKYDEAYPHLMTAAIHGLKNPQAQLGFMHLNGLGPAEKDTRFAIGWLGVAADGPSPPEIEEFFESVWERIPADSRPAYQAVIDKFIANYGTETNNVKCRKVSSVGSRIRTLRCMLTDVDGRHVSDMIEDLGGGLESIGPLGGSPGGGGPP